MMRKPDFFKLPCRSLGILAAAMLCTGMAMAQDRDKYDSIAAKYKNEHAVYTKIAEQLVINVEDGALTANSNVTLEKLFISDMSLNRYNVDVFEYGDFNGVTNYSGNAYLPASGKSYKKVACNSFGSGRPNDYVFYDDRRLAEAYYSGLAKNAITETRYSITHTDVHMLPSFEFQDIYQKLPVASASFEVIAPEYVNLNFVLKGENIEWIRKTTTLEHGKVHYLFTATNVPAYKGFANVPSWRYYVPHVIPYITSYKVTGSKRDSVIAKGPDDLYRYMYNNVRGLNMKVDTSVTQLAARLTQNDATPKDKAAHIYRWVQQNIHYVAIENGLEGFVPRPADTVLKRKYGDCKDMSSIILAMCRSVGLKAYVAWIGTTSLPYTTEETPLDMVSNHMICALKLGEEWVFLDGTHSLLPFGRNREDIQGKEAVIAIDDKTYKIVTIPVEHADKSLTTDSARVTIDGRKLTGELSQKYSGYDAWNIGYGMMYSKKADDEQKMVRKLTARGSDKYVQNRYDVTEDKAGQRGVTVNAAFVIEDYVQNVGKQCFVNMNLLRHFEDNRIDEKDRNVPFYFNHKARHKEVVVLDIPKGYKVSYLPASVKGAMDDKWNYAITYTLDKQKKTVTLVKEYELNAMSIGTDRFAANNKAVDDLKKIYKESVVLTTN